MKKKGLLKLFATCMVTTLLFVGCGTSNNTASDTSKTDKQETTNTVVEAPENLPIATIEVEGYGTMVAELYPQYAPNTVNNFISLANSGFYDGLTFHRVIKSFVLQGGDPAGNGTGGPGYSIKGEFAQNNYKQNTLSHTAGVLSMARTNQPDTAGSQFFIVTEDSDGNKMSLDNKYAGFGKVIEGMDVVSKIAQVKTDSNDKPVEDVKIKSIKVDTKGVDYAEPEKM